MNNVISLRQRKVSDIETAIQNAVKFGYEKIVIVGQLPDGCWSFQFAKLTGKVELIGILEFMKQEVHHSMEEVD